MVRRGARRVRQTRGVNRVSTRNLVWLAVIAVAFVVGWVASGFWVGLIAAVAVLVVSEVYERIARAKRRNARTTP
jgi:hypothetical protein